MPYDQRDPDAALVPLFKNIEQKDERRSREEGRPIHYDMEVCEIRIPGSRLMMGVYPATAFARWVIDPHTGEQVKQSYAERFSQQYRQFKERSLQTKAGTSLDYIPFLTEARRAEMRGLNIYTVEALAVVDGQELKNLGPGGRDLKNQAEEYIASSKTNVPNIMQQQELEAMRARNLVLEHDIEVYRTQQARAEAQFNDMSNDALREYIATHTGLPPVGNSPRKTLLRMAVAAAAAAAGRPSTPMASGSGEPVTERAGEYVAGG